MRTFYQADPRSGCAVTPPLPSAEPSPKLAALLAKALAYLCDGLEPIGVTGKRPTTDGWQDDEITEDRIRSGGLFLEHHTGIGLRTGQLVGVDVDIPDEELAAEVADLVRQCLGPTPYERIGNAPKIILAYRNATPTGKITIVGRWRGALVKVEILGVGQQFVTLGIHPDTRQPYRWVGSGGELKRLESLPEVTPDDLITLADAIAVFFRGPDFTHVKVSGKGVRGDGDVAVIEGEGVLPAGDRRIQAHLMDMRRRLPEFIRTGERDNTLLDIAQKCADRGVPPAEVKTFLLEVIAEGRVQSGSEFVSEVDRLVHQAFRETRENAVGSRPAPFEEILSRLPPPAEESRAGNQQIQVPRLVDGLSEGNLASNQYGKPTASFDNCFRIVSFLNAVPRYNEFAARVEFNEAPEWGDGGRVWTDNMGLLLRAEIMREFNASFELGTVHAAVQTVALYRRFDPLHDYLDALKWDAVKRLDTWLIRLAGAADTPYARAVSRKTLLGAVARALHPGCKFDTALILESATGRNKSQALAILAVSDAWFSDALAANLRDKDAAIAAQGKWIIEVGEVEKLFRKNEAAELKSYLSRRIDTLRRPYGRVAEDLPRRFILIGTTNSESYLNDPTGNRRFWPVRIAKFDLDMLKEERDQLWAEAVHAYRQGESLTLPEELWETAAVEQEHRRAVDPWEEAVADYLAREREGQVLTRVHATDLLTHALGLERGQQTYEHSIRLRQVMTKLGWAYRAQLKLGGRNTTGYVRAEPELQTT